ncbi:MAG TPA: ABC transporter ATP-binding protein [Anaerolineae bacterium]|nr:ABC transporter ATP-binding protein [Anaerolineae bacterium]
MTDSVLVRVEALHRLYPAAGGDVHALRGVNLTISQGQFVLIRGRSGSGKTTLLNCIGALDQPTSGRVWVHGVEVSALSEEERTRFRRHQVGFVFQSFALLPTLSAVENVDLVLRLGGMNARKRLRRVQQCLALVGLEALHNHRPYELSGGQQQRVAIARAIALNPPLLLADEPTGELDSATGIEILALFRRLVDHQGMTIILSSHDPAATTFADVLYRLQDGMIMPDMSV